MPLVSVMAASHVVNILLEPVADGILYGILH